LHGEKKSTNKEFHWLKRKNEEFQKIKQIKKKRNDASTILVAAKIFLHKLKQQEQKQNNNS